MDDMVVLPVILHGVKKCIDLYNDTLVWRIGWIAFLKRDIGVLMIPPDKDAIWFWKNQDDRLQSYQQVNFPIIPSRISKEKVRCLIERLSTRKHEKMRAT